MSEERGSWWPFAVPAVVVVAIIAISLVVGGGGAKPATMTCPKTVPAGAARPSVPAPPKGLSGHAHLAPDRVPLTAVVCRYAGASGQKADPLRGHRMLTGLGDADDTLAYAPRKIATQACPATPALDTGQLLLGLTYVGGTEWIATAADACTATPTTNGVFDSSAQLYPDLRTAYGTGQWPSASTAGACPVKGVGRQGQETALVPNGVSSVDVCRMAGHTVRAHRHASGGAAGELISTLNRLRSTPMKGPGGCSGQSAGLDASTSYALVFHYSQGADVVVDVAASPACRPPVDNGSRQTPDSSAVLPQIMKLLSGS